MKNLLLNLKFVFIFYLLAMTCCAPAFSQEQAITTNTNAEPEYFLNTFLDFVVLGYANYGGEMDAEISSVFAMTLEKYKVRPDLAQLLNGLDEVATYNSLEARSSDFFNRTGVRIYFTGKIEDGSSKRYVRGFNDLLSEKVTVKSDPHIVVRTVLRGNYKTGYTTLVEIDASPEINRAKYDLDENTDKNPFHALSGKFTARRDAGRAIRKGLIDGLTRLTTTFDQNFLPNLMVRYDGNLFKHGETIEVGAQANQWIELTAVNNENQVPSSPVSWQFAPHDSLTAHALMNGETLRFPSDKAGTFPITVRAGRDRAVLSLKITDFRQLLKQVIVNVLSANRQQALDTLAILRNESANNAADLQRYLAHLERGNFPMEEGGIAVPLFHRSLIRADSAAFLSEPNHRNSFSALRRKKKVNHAIRRKLNVVALADLVIDDPDKINLLLEELLRNSGQELAQLLLGSGSREQSARNIVLHYLNQNLERVAGGLYTPEQSVEPPLVIPQPATIAQAFDSAKFLYISPLADFPGKENLIAQLNGYLPTLHPRLYVFINYSHDASAETYLARAPGARPAGLPPGTRYKVFTVLHMPGSVEENVIGSEASTANGTSDGIFEQVKASGDGLTSALRIPEEWWRAKPPLVEPLDAGFVDGALELVESSGNFLQYAFLRLGGFSGMFTPPRYYGRTPGTIMGGHANQMDEPLAQLAKNPKLFVTALAGLKDELAKFAGETAGLDAQAQYNQGRLVFEVVGMLLGAGEVKASIKLGKSSAGLIAILRQTKQNLARLLVRGTKKGLQVKPSGNVLKLLDKHGKEIGEIVDGKLIPSQTVTSGEPVSEVIDGYQLVENNGELRFLDEGVDDVVKAPDKILGSIVKNGNKVEYTNPAGKLFKWSEQGIKDIDNAISTTKKLDPLNSNNIGRIAEGKVGEFVKEKKQLTGFGQKIEPNITDLDVSTLDEIIEVKASFSSVKEEQFAKLLDKSLNNFCNPYQKKVILYIDKPLSEATQAQINMINRIKNQGVTVVHSLEELGGVLK